jgi:hypothetical protein
MEEGAAAVLYKPLERDEVVNRIREALARRRHPLCPGFGPPLTPGHFVDRLDASAARESGWRLWVFDGQNPAHDRMHAAEIGIVPGRKPRQLITAVRKNQT